MPGDTRNTHELLNALRRRQDAHHRAPTFRVCVIILCMFRTVEVNGLLHAHGVIPPSRDDVGSEERVHAVSLTRMRKIHTAAAKSVLIRPSMCLEKTSPISALLA